MTAKKQSTKFGWRWLLALPLLIAALAIVIYAWTFRHLPHHQDPGAWGTFGDYFGGLLNPVVSTLTLFVAIAVWKLQKSELEETRTILAAQARTARQERNEQRFFDLLNLHRRTLESLSSDSRTGLDTIGIYLNSIPTIKNLLTTGLQEYKIDSAGARVTQSSQVVLSTITLNLPELKLFWLQLEGRAFFNPYLRMVSRLLADASGLLGNEDCFRYIKLFRAQLCDAELNLIALHVLLSNEGAPLRGRVEKFGLLKHLPQGPFRSVLEEHLNPTVFGRKFAQEPPAPIMKPVPC